jgi:hypothetical protein
MHLREVGMEGSCSGQEPVAGFFERCNEPSCEIKREISCLSEIVEF